MQCNGCVVNRNLVVNNLLVSQSTFHGRVYVPYLTTSDPYKYVVKSVLREVLPWSSDP